MERFRELAMGAHELRVQVEQANVRVCVDEEAGWTLDWSSDGGGEPLVDRHGAVVRVRGPVGSWGAARRSGAGGRARAEKGRSDAPTDEVVAETWRGSGRLLDLRITVPPGLEVVDLRSGHGDIEAEDVRGRLRLAAGRGRLAVRAGGGEATLKSGSGEISVCGFGGDLSVATGSGDVSLAEVEGEAEVNSGRGAIRIDNARSLGGRVSSGAGEISVQGGSVRPLRLHTGMGAVRCSARLAPGAYEIKTGFGEVSLALPAVTSARVDAQTGWGQVRSDFPLVQVGRSGPLGFGGVRMVGSIGEGQPQVTVALRTGKGDIDLRRSVTRTAGASGYEPARGQSSTDNPDAEQRNTPYPHPAREAPSAREEASVQGTPFPHETPSAPAEPVAPAEAGPGRVGADVTPPEARPQQAPRLDTSLAVLEALARHDITPAEADDLLLGLSYR